MVPGWKIAWPNDLTTLVRRRPDDGCQMRSVTRSRLLKYEGGWAESPEAPTDRNRGMPGAFFVLSQFNLARGLSTQIQRTPQMHSEAAESRLELVFSTAADRDLNVGREL